MRERLRTPTSSPNTCDVEPDPRFKPLKNKELHNVFDASRPVWSGLKFALYYLIPIETFTQDPQRILEIREALPIVFKASRDAIRELDLLPKAQAWDQRFEIEHPKNESDTFTSVILWLFARTQDLLEPGSWPWTLSRQVALLIVGEVESLQDNDFTQHNNQRFGPLSHVVYRMINDQRFGPLGHLTLAYGLKLMGEYNYREVTRRGLQILSPESLSRDLALFYRGSGRLTLASRAFFTALRESSESELKSLAKLFPRGSRGAINQALMTLRDSEYEETEDAVEEMMDTWIKAGLLTWVEAQLKTL